MNRDVMVFIVHEACVKTVSQDLALKLHLLNQLKQQVLFCFSHQIF